VRWRITNSGDTPVRLASAIQPHSQFRTSEVPLDVRIDPGEDRDLRLAVHFDEEPGAVVENAFLILVLDGEPQSRILARVRVTAGPRGEPIAGPSVVITGQTVGVT
jgi:hypothetical protein